MYGSPDQSSPRPQTPSRLDSNNNNNENAFHHQRSLSDISLVQGNVHAQMSPPNPSTPASTSSSNFSHFGFHPYASHSRSTSSSTYPRSNSPAMSVMSAATSMSSNSSRRLSLTAGANVLAITPTAKQKKRLVNRERKEICEYFLAHPNARQEDIAALYGVERSTVSKILKHKDKWLNIPEGENNLVAKHRYVSVFASFSLRSLIHICLFTPPVSRSTSLVVPHEDRPSSQRLKSSWRYGWMNVVKREHRYRIA